MLAFFAENVNSAEATLRTPTPNLQVWAYHCRGAKLLRCHGVITIRCTRSRGPRGFFCLQVVRRGPVNVDVIRLDQRRRISQMPTRSTNPYSAPTVPAGELEVQRSHSPRPHARFAAFVFSLISGYVTLNVFAVSLHGYLYASRRDTSNIVQHLPELFLIGGVIALGFLALYWMAFALMNKQSIAKLRFAALTTSLLLLAGILTFGLANNILFF